MNPQAIASLIRSVAAIIGAVLVTNHLATADDVSKASTDLMTLIPAAMSLGSFLFGVYSHWNMKKVPANTVPPVITTSEQAKNFHLGAWLLPLTLFALADLCHPAHARPFCVDPLNKLPLGCIPASVPNVAKTLNDLLSKPMQDLAAFVNGDFTRAQQLSSAIAGMPDGNGNACWSLLLSAKAIFTPAAPDAPLEGAATALEQLRLLAMVANRVCQNAACTQVFTEAGNAVNTVAPIPNLPSLTSLCSKVPEVAQVAITPAPTITVTPLAAPAAQ